MQTCSSVLLHGLRGFAYGINQTKTHRKYEKGLR